MGKVIGVANIKGGVGKTSLTNALAHEFASRGKKVLVIDTDPQASNTWLFGVEQEEVNEGRYKEHSLLNIYKNEGIKPWKYNENLHVIFSSRFLQDIENLNKAGSELILNRWLRKNKIRNQYDYIFIDPPSNKGTLMMSTILSSDYILIPQRLTFLDETGTVELITEASEQADLRGIEINILGIVPMFFNKRKKIYREKLIRMKEDIKDFIQEDENLNLLNEDVFFTPIRNISVWEKAQEEQTPLRDYILTKDRTYQSVLEEIKKVANEIEKFNN